MKHYIGVKAIKAEPMTVSEFNALNPGKLDGALDPDESGYLVEYDTGYQSWSPKEAFERSHLELNDPTKITEDDLNRFVGPDAFSARQLDEKTSMVKVEPRTGFVHYETSSCVDPANFDHALSCNIALGKIKDKIWPMLGFVLQWANFGLKPLPEAEGVTDADSPQPVQ